MKRNISRFMIVVAVLLLLAAVLFGALQTRMGKTAFASMLSRALSRSENMDIRIGTISGWIPGHVRIDHVEMGDVQGVWLSADNVRCRWIIHELFAGRIRLRELGADAIVWNRFPASVPSAERPKSTLDTSSRFEIQLDGLQVGHLSLGKDVAGIPLEYAVRSGGVFFGQGKLSGGVAIRGDAEGWVDFETSWTKASGDQLKIRAELTRMNKPTFGLDRLSGSGEATIDTNGVSASIIAQLEEKGQTGNLSSHMHYGGGQLKLEQFEFKGANVSLDGEMTLGFSKGLVDVALQADMVDAHTNHYTLRSTAAVATGNKTWAVDLHAMDVSGWDAMEFTLSGNIDPQAMRLEGALKEVGVDRVPLAGLSGFNGRVSGRFSIDGSLEQPRVDAGIEVLGFRSKRASLEELPSLDFSLAGGVADGRWFASTSVTNFNHGYLSVELDMPGGFSLSPCRFQIEPEKMQGRLDADLDLDVFNGLSFMDNQRVQGVLKTQLKRENQSLSGFLKLEQGGYEHYDWGILVRDFNAELEAAPDGFMIRRAIATDGRAGRVGLSGSVRGGMLDIALNLSEDRIVQRPEVEAVVSGSIKLTGMVSHPVVKGGLVITRADIYPDNIMPPKPLLLTNYDARSAGLRGKSSRTGKRLPFNLDVGIKMPDQIYVNASLIDSVWGGALNLTSMDTGVSIKGSITPRRGFVDFVGKKFRFTQGEVLFDGRVPSAPVLNNLTAEYSRNGFTARLVLNGSVHAPVCRIESTPAMPQDEVLSHVLFNRDTSSISPYQILQIAAAAKQLSGGLGGPGFMYQFRQAVGIDTLEWREPVEEGGSSSVAAGKYITSDLYVEVNSTFGEEASTGMTAEYELNRHISIETSAGPKIRPGIGIGWKNDY